MGNETQPDWYADPTGIHHHRYWDGAQWTAHVADRYGATSTHHVQEQYPPPGATPAPPAPIAEVPELVGDVEPQPYAMSTEIER